MLTICTHDFNVDTIRACIEAQPCIYMLSLFKGILYNLQLIGADGQIVTEKVTPGYPCPECGSCFNTKVFKRAFCGIFRVTKTNRYLKFVPWKHLVFYHCLTAFTCRAIFTQCLWNHFVFSRQGFFIGQILQYVEIRRVYSQVICLCGSKLRALI